MARQGPVPLQGPQTLWQGQPPARVHWRHRLLALMRQLRPQARALHPHCHPENR